MLVLLDNYDSFTYNLYQLFSELGSKVKVVLNDETTVDEIERLNPSRLVISPGPSHPSRAGVSKAAVGYFAGRIPLLGVCLGHQCIVEALGGSVGRSKQVMHGKKSSIRHDQRTIFAGLPSPISVVRYHSLKANQHSLPPELEVSATSEDDGLAMAVRHNEKAVEGLQFHPESYGTEHGRQILENFLKL